MAKNKDNWELVGMPNTWDFKTEVEVAGTYIRMKENVGENASNIYTLLGKKGNIGVWGSSVLDSKFEDIAIGDEVKIVYKGNAKNPKSGRTYHDFEVYRRPAPFVKVVGDDDNVNLEEIMQELEN